MKVKIVVIAFFVGLLGFLSWAGVRTYHAIMFDRGCQGYLKQAADANTIELAHERLAIAVEYAKTRGLKDGFTSVFYQTPKDDVGFWYTNLTHALNKLAQAKERELNEAEEAQVLDKLRETLLDRGENESVTVPPGITVFGYNRLYALFVAVSLLLMLTAFCIATLDS